MSHITPGRLPYRLIANIFYYLRMNDLYACMLVCRHWYGYLADENCEIWRILYELTLPESARNDPQLLCHVPTYKSRLRVFYNAWNPNDCSRNIYVKVNAFTVHRNPIAQRTDGARGKRGYKEGRHSWEVWWEGPLGTVAVMGVGTRHAAMQSYGYLPLLGSDDQGWSWNLVDNTLLHNGQTVSSYPAMNNPPKYQPGERVTVVLDCDDHVLYFERDSEFMGVAFRDLPSLKLYPIIAAVYANTEITMVYLGPPSASPPDLDTTDTADAVSESPALRNTVESISI